MAAGPSVLVGYDGTRESDHAVRWAAEEARLRRADLIVCHCWRWPHPISHADYDLEQTVKRMGQHVLERGVNLAREAAPAVHVRPRLMDGPAYAALLHESHGAELIVIGSHENRTLAIGSTALQVPARAHQPVLVVRPAVPANGRAGRGGRVVVGVDGSPASSAALAFGFEEATLRGWRLEAVHGGWDPGAVAGSELALFADKEELKRSSGAMLQRAVTPWRDKYPRVDVETTLVLEGPRSALLDASKRADLLVVGDRGTGTVSPLLLGATSTAVLQHASCSVAVTHATARG
jgi:nucleotide-binding universal stress UspA family protein